MRDGDAIGREFGARHTPDSVGGFMEMMAKFEPKFEPHPILFEFLDIIQSGRAAPGTPHFLHRAIARASVSLLPDPIRRRLDLGEAFDLRRTDRLMLRAAGKLADRFASRGSAASTSTSSSPAAGPDAMPTATARLSSTTGDGATCASAS